VKAGGLKTPREDGEIGNAEFDLGFDGHGQCEYKAGKRRVKK
jgi:hypothetical protein